VNKEQNVFSTGFPGLDSVLHGIWSGDNVVWEIDQVDDFLPFVHNFCYHAHKKNMKLIYFRFARHSNLVPEDVDAEIYKLNPQDGFENFLSEIFDVIEEKGKGVCYVFDSLSGLAVDWYSDRMLGNFFRLTCPYLYDFETVTYFVIMRNAHTTLAVNAIHNTAQIVIDIYNKNKELFIHPLKVFKRHSPTMYMLHRWEGETFKPVVKSMIISEILSEVPQDWIDVNINRNDIWTNTFLKARKIEEKYEEEHKPFYEYNSMIDQIIRMILTRDEKLYLLCRKYFCLSDLISIGKRMIGTGLIGGKSVGMLLARAILIHHNKKCKHLLETHDSFFIGSDIFYTYVIQNKCWWDRYHLKKSEDFLEHSEGIRGKLSHGVFPQDILEQFKEMLNYFGQSPIIVRSSSLLEDAYGNAFSGKYESVFCTNQGNPEERLESFIKAVQKVYASTMSKNALSYRTHLGLLEMDEQMAILVQRVSGSFYKHLYFPHIAGVGYSFNPYVWNSRIDPQTGVLRLVFGLGTRAVDRHDEDYTRVVALNAPLLRPEATYDEVRKYTQHTIDILDLKEHKHDSRDFEYIVKTAGSFPLHIFATKDREMEERARELNLKHIFPWVLTFEELLTKTNFVKDMEEMLAILGRAYEHPVDIEFTVNFFTEDDYRINLLQCRPFQFSGEVKQVELPTNISACDIILKTRGPIIGQNMVKPIDTIIFVNPERYSVMAMTDRYAIARLVGELANRKGREGNVMLIGPGRWGTTMPALGIPVSFAEIKNVSALCEIVKMHEGLVPDISLGTHFFNDLVEMDIIYIAIFPDKEDYILNEKLIKSMPNRLESVMPNVSSWKDTVMVVDTADLGENPRVILHVNTLEQEGVLFSRKGC
jgi:pyruvate,water dikinase